MRHGQTKPNNVCSFTTAKKPHNDVKNLKISIEKVKKKKDKQLKQQLREKCTYILKAIY